MRTVRTSAREQGRKTIADAFGELKAAAEGLFGLMGILEEEVADARLRHPAATDKIERCFGALAPSLGIRGFAPIVFRSHARELLDRVGRGEDLRPATNAEVMAMFYRTSLDAPLNSIGMLCYEVTFERVFRGDERAEKLLAEKKLGSEGWKGQLEEALADARRRLAQPWREVGCRVPT